MNFVDFLLYFVVPILVGVYLFLRKKYSFFEEQGIPHLKPSIIFGHMKGVGSDFHMADLVKKIYDYCKDKDVVGGLYTLTSPSLVLIDLDVIKHILVKDFNTFTDRGVFVNEEKEPLTGHLFAVEGEKWRFLRNKLSPAFTSGKIKMMFNTISDKGQALVEAMAKESKTGSLEMKDIANRFNIDVISNCAFGLNANTLSHENENLVRIFRKTFGAEGQSPLYFFFLFAFPNFSKLLGLRQFDEDITNFFNEVISDSVQQREKSGLVRNDLLNMLIQLKEKGSIDGEISTESKKLTMSELIAQACMHFLNFRLFSICK
jgi:cytochrome P450 family 6